MKLNSEMNEELNALSALALAAATPVATVSSALRERVLTRVMARVHDSAAQTQRMVTVRHGDTPWRIVQPGVSTRDLHDNGTTRTRMVALQPSAVWAQPLASEVLVVQGETGLQGHHSALPAESFVLTSGAAHFAGRGRGALLYVREMHGAPSALPAAEQGWWLEPGAATVAQPAAADDVWLPFSPGVQIKPLHGSETSMSLLACFEPGASVGAHSHGLDEDCIMLRGDLYLGDTLLREGEYQLAPAGTGHRGLASDHGSVLFFHGAIDSALRGG